jgi:hypothetical protein
MTSNLPAPIGPPPAVATQTTAVEAARAVAEVAAAVRVAQEVPRDTRRAFAEMQEACRRLGLAERSFYRVPNRGTGPSVHLARELARIWGNVDYGVHELSRDDDRGMSEVRAYAWDQQTNVRSSRTFQVPHAKMAGGSRKTLTDLGDVYLNNQNVGARAVRETILSVLPRDYVDEAIDLCRATLQNGGDGAPPLLERVDRLVRGFAAVGVTVAQLERKVGRGRGQWTPVDVADLTVIGRSIKAGESTAADEFPDPDVSPATIDRIPPPPAVPVTLPREPAAAENRAAAGPDPDEGVDPDGDWPEPATPGGGEQS